MITPPETPPTSVWEIVGVVVVMLAVVIVHRMIRGGLMVPRRKRRVRS